MQEVQALPPTQVISSANTASSARRAPNDGVPAHLPAIARNVGHLCPITLDPVGELADAVLAEDQYIYDRSALTACLRLSPLSPMTQQPMLQTHRALLGASLVGDGNGQAQIAHFVAPEPARETLTEAYVKLALITSILGTTLHNLYTLHFLPGEIRLNIELPSFMRNDLGQSIVLGAIIGLEVTAFARRLATIRDLHRHPAPLW